MQPILPHLSGINIENLRCKMAFICSQQLVQKTPTGELQILGIRLSKTRGGTP